MEQFLGISSAALVAFIAVLLVYNLYSKKYELMSLRNIFLLGMLFFYGFGGYYTWRRGAVTEVYSPGETGYFVLAMALPVFIVAFLLAGAAGWRATALTRVLPPMRFPVTTPAIWVCAAACLALSVVASVPGEGSYLQAAIGQGRAGIAGVGVALATYYALCRRFNPLAWALLAGVFAVALLVSSVGEIGRRGVLSVPAAVGFMWWYTSLRNRRIATGTVLKLGGLGAAAFLFIASYASVRGQTGGAGLTDSGYDVHTRLGQMVQLISNPRVEMEAVEGLLVSDAPTASMFFIENYGAGKTFPAVPFQGLWFAITNPIPRFLLDDKPIGLGKTMQLDLRLNANIGVGIIGHGAAEGGWLGIIGYALVFGFALSVADRALRERANNPYFVAWLGASLGNVFGIARGETSLFVLIILTGMFWSGVTLYSLNLVLGSFFKSFPPVLPPSDAPGHTKHEDEYMLDELDAYGVSEDEVRPERAELVGAGAAVGSERS